MRTANTAVVLVCFVEYVVLLGTFFCLQLCFNEVYFKKSTSCISFLVVCKYSLKNKVLRTVTSVKTGPYLSFIALYLPKTENAFGHKNSNPMPPEHNKRN